MSPVCATQRPTWRSASPRPAEAVRAVVQRVARASVTVNGTVTGAVGTGLLVLLGVGQGDTPGDAERLAAKVAALRVFEDEAGKMNRSCLEAGGSVLCISQFTLFGDVRRGNRPSFEGAAAPELADTLYQAFCQAIERAGLACQRGVFGAHMDVELLNNGPVTLILDTEELKRPRH